MLGLDGRHGAERCGDLGKSLGLGRRGEVGIEHVPLLLLALGGCQQVFGRGADAAGRIGGRDGGVAPFEELEETLGVLLLLLGGLQKYSGYLFVSLFLRYAGEERITAASLALAGECLEQILLGLCPFDAFHDLCFFIRFVFSCETKIAYYSGFVL